MAAAIIVIICFSVFSGLLLRIVAQQSSSDWPMFRSDPSHSGVGTGDAVLTPMLMWKYPMGGISSSAAVAAGVVYVGSSDNNVYALNGTDGGEIWNYTMGGGVSFSSPGVFNGIVYIGSNDRNIYALNATTGAKIWNYSTGNFVSSSPAVVNGVVYVGSNDHNVYALNATSGARLWNYSTGNFVSSSPAVVNGVVYVGSLDDNVYALNATSGVNLWNYSTGGNIAFSSPAVGNGVVYVGSNDHNVYALNATDGTKIWNCTTGLPVDSSPAVSQGVVYVGSMDGNVYALNAVDGAIIWSYAVGNPVDSSPAIVDGVVYIGSLGHNIYALNSTNGANLWSFTTGSTIPSSPAVVNGVVYIGSEDGYVYALGGSGNPTPSSSPSPTPTSPPYNLGNFPTSIFYQPYTNVGIGLNFTQNVPAGPTAVSVGAMDGTVAIEVSQNDVPLLSTRMNGEFSNYVVVSASNSYCYVNFVSNGLPVNLTFSSISGNPLVAFNVYNNYISAKTASLITYPPHFAVWILPGTVPVNTGISFLLVAPTYSLPTPLSIFVFGTYTNSQTGQYWQAQVGFNDWPTTFYGGFMNVSHAGWGIFSNIFGNPGGSDYNYSLIPGDTYNFTMALVSDTTWEFLVNDTLIQEPGLNGLYNTTTSYCNGAYFGLETLTYWGGNVGINNSISIPMIMSFRVNGQWVQASSFSFNGLNEWWDPTGLQGTVSNSPGIDLWGIAGHLQDSSIPNGALVFNDSLPMIMYVPTVGSEPLCGNFSLPQLSSGGDIVTVTKISNVALQVTPVNGIAYVSIASYDASNSNITSLINAKISGSTYFNVPSGTVSAVVYAADSSFSKTSSSTVSMTSSPTPTPTSTPTQNPTAPPTSAPTSSTTPQPTAKPNVSASSTPIPTPITPEFPSIILLLTVVSIACTAILFCVRNSKK